MKYFGIQLRLRVAAFMIIFFTTLVLVVMTVRVTGEFMHNRFRDRIEFLAEYLALNSEVGVLIGDRTGLNSLARNLLGEEDVVRVDIYDDNEKQLVSLERENHGPSSMIEAPIILKRKNQENFVFDNRMTPFGKVKLKGEDYIGKVRIYYSTSGINELISKLTYKFVLFSLCLTALAALLFYLISKPIVREVRELAATAKQVGRGDLELRATPGKIPEMRSLTLDFNSMLNHLNESREALDKVNRQVIQQKSLAELGKFSLMVAHEVKNPLGIINSSLYILKKELKIPDENLMVEYIEDEIRRLNRLIEDFLMFARPNKPKFRQVNANEMLTSIVERFQIQKEKAPAVITADIPNEKKNVIIDHDLITRGLSNIIKNGCDAAGQDGWVGVHAFSCDEKWVIEIADDGNGIEPGHLSRIFEPFFTTRSKGTGLGLAFASHVVKAHGGSIIAENR
jgi:signal transduction histidine kinase